MWLVILRVGVLVAAAIGCKQRNLADDLALTSAPISGSGISGPGASPSGEAAPMAARLSPRAAPVVNLAGEFQAPPPSPNAGPRIAAIALETRVYSAPDRRSTQVGLLRAGAVVHAAADNVEGPGCAAGFAKIQSSVVGTSELAEGYVCLDSEATRDLNHPIALASTPPNLAEKLPYIYGTVKRGGPVYARIPTDEVLASFEPHLGAHLARWKRDPDWGASYGLELWTRKKTTPPPDALQAYEGRITDADLPLFLADDRVLPNLSGQIRSQAATKLAEVSTHNGIAFLDTYLVRGRRYGLTTDLRVLPTDRLRAIRGSDFHGVRIPDEATIPFAIVRKKGFKRLRRQAHRWVGTTPLEPREIVSLTGQYKFYDGVYYYETKEGDYIEDRAASKVEPLKRPPGWAQKGEKWIEINVSKQLLLAYEGETPVYATLVSTGEAGLGDPETTKSTRLGIFRIHTKFVSATMDSKTVGEEFELRDVPYVQYFQDGYALHAAYWHDVFGMPKSHGCVNLAPEDARRIFHWTDPQVPSGWHGARKALTGTVVFVHR